MLNLTLDREYKAAIYLRLSREDGDFSVANEKTESNSISNHDVMYRGWNTPKNITS